jgi:hypothetical protein
MTPRDVDRLTAEEYRAFWDYVEQEARDQERAARRAARRKG